MKSRRRRAGLLWQSQMRGFQNGSRALQDVAVSSQSLDMPLHFLASRVRLQRLQESSGKRRASQPLLSTAAPSEGGLLFTGPLPQAAAFGCAKQIKNPLIMVSVSHGIRACMVMYVAS